MTQGKAISTSKKVYPCSFTPLFECRSGALSGKGSISGMFTYEVEYKDKDKDKSATVVLNIPFKSENRDGYFFVRTVPQIIGSKRFFCESVFTTSENKYSEVLLNFTSQEDNYEQTI